MAYRDHPNGQHYTDPADAFNPYDTRQPHQTYEQGGYNYGGGYTDEPHGPTAAGTRGRPDSIRSELDNESEEPHAAPRSQEKRSRNQTFKAFRYDAQGNLWTKGGKGRCVGRFCCCTLMIAIFLIVSIIFTIILWVRPPDVGIGAVQPMSTNGSAFQLTSAGLNVDLGVNISVQNPNFFSVSLKTLKLQLFYPINNTAIGSGQKNDIVIRSNEQTNFTFPFTFQYTLASDPSRTVLTDLANKCTANQDLTVNYKITLGLQIVVATISPVISNSFTFACPLNGSELLGLSGAGLSLRNLPG